MNARKSLCLPTIICLSVLLQGIVTLSAEEKPAKEAAAAKPSTASTEAVAGSAPAGKEPAAAKPQTLPTGIEEIVRMSEAGVSPEVLTRYIESSGIAYEPTGADLIAMKQRGVPDDVTVVVLARSSAIRAEYEAARRKIAAPAIVRTLSTDGQLDPESYEFFWYHHAYPRALAGSYQTLSPSAQSYHFRGSRKTHDSGPKWRTDGFTRDSLRSESPRRTNARR